MGLFDKIKQPVVLKADNSARLQLAELEMLLSRTTDSKIKASIERDIAAVNAGIYGENAILFELQNSHLPMLIIHDLYLEYEGLSAQIDFLVITRKLIHIIECKNLYGNITINNLGDFIRTFGGKKEGIYSPITQAKRHLELIKQIRSAEKGNFISKALFERYFYDAHRSVVVLANPKTVFDAKYAKKEIRDQVIRSDRLIDYIKKSNAESSDISFSENDMEQLANFFLSKHRICKTDYAKKYKQDSNVVQDQLISPEVHNDNIQNTPDSETAPTCPKCGTPMVKRKSSKDIPDEKKEFWGCSNFPKCRGIIPYISSK